MDPPKVTSLALLQQQSWLEQPDTSLFTNSFHFSRAFSPFEVDCLNVSNVTECEAAASTKSTDESADTAHKVLK